MNKYSYKSENRIISVHKNNKLLGFIESTTASWDIMYTLITEIEDLQAQLERERKTVDYYANTDIWYNKFKYGADSLDQIEDKDLCDDAYGGKLARETQKLRKEQ